MKYIYIIVVFVLGINSLSAQDFRYGKVSKEELGQKIHPIDSSANAAVLYREEKINFIYTDHDGFMQEREVYERVKIYNKEGYKWATKKVYIYKGGSGKTEKLSNLQGTTYNLSNGKINKDKLRKEGIFEEEYNEYTGVSTLTMPNIQDGAVIEYSYKIISPFLAIDDIYFQSFIPTDKLEVFIATPQFYAYNKQVNIKALYLPKFKDGRANKIYNSTSSSRSGVIVTKTQFNTSKSEYFDNTIAVSEENIPAVKEESYAGNIDNYISKMSFELSAILNKYGSIEKAFSSSWDKVSKTIYSYKSFGGQFEKTNVFKDDLVSILKDVDNPLETTAVIFNHVKSKVKWNGNNGYTSNNGIREAYKEGIGNVGDINLLLISMLKSQGINANPVLVSTKNNGIPIFPTRNGFNYVICAIEQDDNVILLDATDPYSSPNVLPVRVLNWQGRIVRDNETSGWIPLRPTKMTNETTFLNVKLNEDLSAEGKVRKSITSHAALLYRNEYASMTTEDHVKEIEKDKEGIEISELDVNNAKKIMNPLQITYNFQSSDAIDEVGSLLYFTPLFFLKDTESPFKLEKRNYPIDFVMPQQDKYLINIMIPENYKVESMPTSEVVSFNEGDISYSYKVNNNGQYIQISIIFQLKNSLIDPLDYVVFKGFYEKIIEKQSEQIVLTKA
ncbi:DUF3857 domain-containing protein [Winogradskyella ludwigii]|uniref:DUF3857 domain-containing protein n=1 Tax=Winogradskyella ludwigii TaxID=2686076 RepID=UPI0015CA938E|nr:DUF3857 domain-containing protein [Winogradskyella ludwigii]